MIFPEETWPTGFGSGQAEPSSVRSVLRAEDPEQVAHDLFGWSEKLVGIDGAILYVVDGDALIPRFSFELAPDSIEGARLPLSGDGIVQLALRSGAIQMVHGPVALGSTHTSWATTVCVPLTIDGDPIGVYATGWTVTYELGRETLLVLEAAASMAASAIHRAQLLHEVKREQQRLRLLLESLPIPAIQFTAPEMTMTQLNAEARELLGEIQGRQVWDLLVATGAEAADGTPLSLERTTEVLMSGGSGRRLRIRAADGSVRFVLPQVARFGVSGGVITLIDATSETNLEGQRQRFIRMVSHHLRTPLTPLRGYADLLRSEQGDNPILRQAASDMAAAVEQIMGQIRRLEQIVNLRVVDEGDLETVSVASLVDAAWREVSPERGDLLVDDPEKAQVSCRPEHVITAMVEVFRNAHTHGRPPVVAKVSQGPGRVEVSIEDSGPGIPPEWASAVFSPYLDAQPGYLAPAAGQLGLGLTLARGLMEATHGELSYEGSRFVLRLLEGDR